jgi:hypothetical protein
MPTVKRLEAADGMLGGREETGRKLCTALEKAGIEFIDRFVAEHNAEPKPFTWTADPDKIIQAARRGQQVLDSNHSRRSSSL